MSKDINIHKMKRLRERSIEKNINNVFSNMSYNDLLKMYNKVFGTNYSHMKK